MDEEWGENINQFMNIQKKMNVSKYAKSKNSRSGSDEAEDA